MDSPVPKYVFPYHIPAFATGAPPVAGVYYLDGRCHVAGELSPQEADLLERGAIRIATVRFDGGGGEVVAPDRVLRSMNLREALFRFTAAVAN
jgi:hypothetical protein